MVSTFPSAPDNIAASVTNATAERDVHPLLHNQLADAVNAIETYLLPGGSGDLTAHMGQFDAHPFYLLKTGGTLTGSLLLPNGSPSAPSLAFSSDSNTGLYYGSDALRFSINGTEELLLDQYGLSISSELDVGSQTRMRGSLLFTNDNSHDIGQVGANRPRNIYAGSVIYTPDLASAGSILYVGTTTAHDLQFYTNNVTRWEVDGTTGHLLPILTEATDIGNANKSIRNLFLASYVEQLWLAAAPAAAPAGRYRLYPKTDGYYQIDSSGRESKLGGAARVKAGAPTDADFTSPVDGLLAVDSTTNRQYVRVGGAWRYTALT